MPVSETAKRTRNPIREIVDGMKLAPNPSKDVIPLSIGLLPSPPLSHTYMLTMHTLGDPTIFGNLKVHESILDKLQENTRSFKYNGYPPSVGYADARAAIASRYSTEAHPLGADVGLQCFGVRDIHVPAGRHNYQRLLRRHRHCHQWSAAVVVISIEEENPRHTHTPYARTGQPRAEYPDSTPRFLPLRDDMRSSRHRDQDVPAACELLLLL